MIVRAFSGYNANHGSLILPEVLKADHKWDLMTCFYGTNDAALTNQATTIEEYSENLQIIIDIARSYKIPIIIITPTWHDDELSIVLEGKTIGSLERNRKYADAAVAVAKKNGVEYIDLFNEFDLTKAKPAELLIDGVHFTPRGNDVLFEAVTKVIETKFPRFAASKLPLSLLPWRDLCKDTEGKSREEINKYLFP